MEMSSPRKMFETAATILLDVPIPEHRSFRTSRTGRNAGDCGCPRRGVWLPRLIPSGSLSLGFLAVLAATPGLSAQDTVTVSGEVTCSACVITFDTVVTIGGLDGPGLHQITQYADVAVDRRGRIYVVDFMQPEIAVFDATGEFIRTLGRRGEGPGEYRDVAHINTGPEYIHVFDRYRGRTLLDHDLNVVDMHRFPADVVETFVTDSDEVVWVGDVPTSASVGHRIHTLGPTGEIRSFGGDRSNYRGPSGVSPVVTGDSGTLWTVDRSTSRLTRWDLSPEPKVGRVFERTVEEFERANPDGPWPPAIHAGIMVDDSGLWIVWNSKDPEWTERRAPMSPPPEVPPRRVWEGWVELVDPSTGRTLARHRSDGFITGVAHGSRYLVGYYETDRGVPYIHLLAPRVSTPP